MSGGFKVLNRKDCTLHRDVRVQVPGIIEYMPSKRGRPGIQMRDDKFLIVYRAE
jgi:hypothetical protein